MDMAYLEVTNNDRSIPTQRSDDPCDDREALRPYGTRPVEIRWLCSVGSAVLVWRSHDRSNSNLLWNSPVIGSFAAFAGCYAKWSQG
jgi:hypothetical protein